MVDVADIIEALWRTQVFSISRQPLFVHRGVWPLVGTQHEPAGFSNVADAATAAVYVSAED